MINQQETTIQEIEKIFFKHNRTLTLSNEKILQNEISTIFTNNNIPFEKEFRLDDKNIVDFMINGLAIEIKINSKVSRMNIYRQLERYALNDKVETILLISSKTMTLPESINNKPIYILQLGRTQF
jgi:hypothetical protein